MELPTVAITRQLSNYCLSLLNHQPDLTYLRFPAESTPWPITPPMAAPPTVPKELPPVSTAPATPPMAAPVAAFFCLVDKPEQPVSMTMIIALMMVLFITLSSQVSGTWACVLIDEQIAGQHKNLFNINNIKFSGAKNQLNLSLKKDKIKALSRQGSASKSYTRKFIIGIR